jgi:hypothetical protein
MDIAVIRFHCLLVFGERVTSYINRMETEIRTTSLRRESKTAAICQLGYTETANKSILGFQ